MCLSGQWSLSLRMIITFFMMDLLLQPVFHYGHLVASTLKDIVPRYWTMRGKRVERRFGWDTHGLPIEMLVEKSWD